MIVRKSLFKGRKKFLHFDKKPKLVICCNRKICSKMFTASISFQNFYKTKISLYSARIYTRYTSKWPKWPGCSRDGPSDWICNPNLSQQFWAILKYISYRELTKSNSSKKEKMRFVIIFSIIVFRSRIQQNFGNRKNGVGWFSNVFQLNCENF